MNYSVIRIVACCIYITALLHSKVYSSEPDTSNFAAFAYTNLINKDNTVDKVLFAPHDAPIIERVLIGLIRSTETAIVGALFRLSNKKIIEELIAAHNRGVVIDIILDPEAMSASQEISKLSRAGILLSLHSHKKSNAYMHHKFLIFRNTLSCAQNNNTPIPAVLASGSLNLTEQGLKGNYENISFRTNEEIIGAFTHEITELKKGTDTYVLTNTQSSRSKKVPSPTKASLSRMTKLVRHVGKIRKLIH